MTSVKNIFDIVDKTKLRNNKALNSRLISPICKEAYKQIIFSKIEKVPDDSDALVIGSWDELFQFDYIRLVDKVMNTKTWKERAKYILSTVAEQDVKNSLAGLFEAHIISRYLVKVEREKMETIETYNDLADKYNIQQQYSGYGIYKRYNKITYTSVYLKPKNKQLGINESTKYIAPVQFPLVQPTQYLSDFGTTGKTELADLSPLYIDFLLEGAENPQKAKRIFVTDPPTGSGKSFSIASLFTAIASAKDRDEVCKQCIYITDTRENTIAAYEDTIRKMSESPVAASQINRVLLLKSKKDNMFDKAELLNSLPDDIKKMKSWKNLTRIIKLISRLKNDSELKQQDVKAVEDDLNEIINAFQNEIKLHIESEYKNAIATNSGTYENVLDFISKKYPKIIEIFPEIRLKYYKYIFATTDKATFPVDTMFEGKYSLFTDSHQCLFCIDESDAQKIVLAKKIIRDSQKSESDLLDIVKIAIPNLYTHTLTIPDQDVQDLMPQIKELYEQACSLRKEYKLDHTINLDSQSASFMKIRKDSVIASAKNISSYFEMNENNEINITPDAIDTTLDSQTFVQKADSIKNKFFEIIKKIANRSAKNEVNDTEVTHYQNIHSLLGKYFGNKYDATALDLMTVAIDRYKSTEEDASDDYYLYPGSYAKFSQNGNNMLAPAIKSFNMHTTPERMLSELAQDNYIIMLSATAQNESPARNFDFSWQLLNSKLYSLDSRQRALESKYIQSRDKYSDRVKYDIKIIPNYIDKKIPDLIKILIPNEDKVQDIIQEVKERIDEIKIIYNKDSNKESTAQYNFEITIGIIWSMLNFAVNKNKFCLGLEMKSIDKSIQVYQHVSKIIQLINDNSQQQIYWESAKAENIRARVETCQNNVGPNSTVVLWTTYQTAAKGLNLRVRWKKEWGYDDIVAVNESGEKNFDLDEMYVDLDGLYCGKLTHILSTFESEDDGFDAQTIKVMSAISMLDSLKQTGAISDEEYNERVQLAMNGKDTDVQNSLSGLTETKMYICKIGADLAQSFGRITRCNNRFKTATIIISNMLVEQIKKYSQDEMFGKISNNFRYTTKKIIDFIFNNSKQSKKLTRAPAKDTTKKSAELIHNDLCHVHSETETYKKHRAAIKRLCIPDKERIQYLHSSDNDEHYIGAQYLPLSAKAFSAGYSYGPEDMRKIDDVDYVEQVFELVEKPIRVSRAELNLSKQNQEILDMLNEKGYNFDTDVTGNMQCMLTPAAFSILKGNVGEEITRLLFSKIGHQCEELPSEIYEKADFVITDYVENGCVIAIDSKYYDLDKLDKYDDKKKKIPYFRQKFLDIKNYYHVKKVVGIVINTQQTDEDDLDSHRVFCANDDVTIITIPNIYDENGNFNREILKTLTHLIDT